VEFGGLDILVSNAGLASSAPIEETTLALWNKNMDILSTGYFLVSREAFRIFRSQKIGGNVVFVGSKNGLAASPRRIGLLHGQGRRNPSGPLPGARRRIRADPRQCRQPGCGAARLQDLGRRVEGAARRRPTRPTRKAWRKCIASARC
jgi:NAD(P)-dependent dehydrogenase (short-subunit alcohol dehydrogenase family)